LLMADGRDRLSTQQSLAVQSLFSSSSCDSSEAASDSSLGTNQSDSFQSLDDDWANIFLNDDTPPHNEPSPVTGFSIIDEPTRSLVPPDSPSPLKPLTPRSQRPQTTRLTLPPLTLTNGASNTIIASGSGTFVLRPVLKELGFSWLSRKKHWVRSAPSDPAQLAALMKELTAVATISYPPGSHHLAPAAEIEPLHAPPTHDLDPGLDTVCPELTGSVDFWTSGPLE
jgi:hypothetical protein